MTPENTAQAQLLFQLILLLATVGNSILIARKLFGQSERREVTFGQSFVPKEECRLTRESSDRRIAALENQIEEVRTQLLSERADIDARIEAKITRLHVRLDEMERAIGDMPLRIVAMLRNAAEISPKAK